MTRIVVTPLTAADRTGWTELWRLYLEFYRTVLPPEAYAHTWQRLTAPDGAIRGFGARLDAAEAPLVGIVHYLFHDHAWSAQPVCYLQDLYVDQAARGQGAGQALIEATAAAGRAAGCFRLYWMTETGNATARSLYDRVARFNGFIRYDYPLG